MKSMGKMWDYFFICQMLVPENYIPFHDLEPTGISSPAISISPEALFLIKDEFDHMSFLSKQILDVVMSPVEIDKKSKRPVEEKKWTPTDIRRHFTRKGYAKKEVSKAMKEIKEKIPYIL